jgi:HlyD family secretion protein
MRMIRKQTVLTQITVAIAIIATVIGWYMYQQNQTLTLPAYIASGNGRIEATEYDIATKYAGRLAEVLAEEGDMINRNQVVALMDTRDLDTQIREAKASLVETEESREYALAMLEVRKSELNYAKRDHDRVLKLAGAGHVSQEELDQAKTNYQTARATVKAARIQVTQAKSSIEAATARLERLEAELTEMRLLSPVQGRALYKLAQTGEVLGAGGKVFSILDLTDVNMTIFLPTEQAGKIAIGADARIILDAAPEYIIPAKVSFVAPRTQFTPKAVETRTEREKLMFRVKVRVDPTLLKEHIDVVKTGVPGEAFILLDRNKQWPDYLKVNLP